MSFHSPDWENPEIDFNEVEKESNLQPQKIQKTCPSLICSPDPGAWTWGSPVPSPSLERENKNKK